MTGAEAASGASQGQAAPDAGRSSPGETTHLGDLGRGNLEASPGIEPGCKDLQSSA